MRSRPLASSVAIAVLGLAIVVASLLTVLGRYEREYEGVAYGSTLPSVPLANVLPYGLNVDLIGQDEAVVRQSLELLQQGGFVWLRQPFHWRQVEVSRGTFEWEPWDRIISLCRAYNFKLIAVLDGPPVWARQDEDFPNSPPKDFGEYARFVAAFAERYRGQVDHLQIWDEPNIFPNWGYRPVDAASYTALLTQAYETAKEANPDCVILTAGLAPNVEPGGANMSDLLFLRGMYRAGARGNFDVLAAEPYGMALGADDRRVGQDTLNFSRVLAVRQVMLENGDDSTAVWAVEFGWNSLPQDWRGKPTIWGGVSEEDQARFTTRAFERARDEWPWMGVMCVQGFFPWVERDDPLYGFSIVDWNLAPRPVFRAVEALATGDQYAGVGRHYVNDPRFEWQGRWLETANHRVGSVGARLVVPFKGTSVDLLVERGSAPGRLLVTVDGLPANLLPEREGAGHVELRPSEPEMELIRVASGLEDAGHRLEVTVAPIPGGPLVQGVAIEGVVTMRDTSRAGYFLVVAGLLAAGLLLLRWLWRLLRRPESLATVLRIRGEAESLWVTLGWRWGRLPESAREAIILGAGVASVVAVCVSLEPWAAALGGLVLLVFAWWQPESALSLVLMVAPFYLAPFKMVPEGSRPVVSPVEALIIACTAAWIIRRLTRWRSGPVLLHPTLHDLAVGLFVVAAMGSLMVAERPREALRELRTIIIEPVVFYYLVMACVREKGLARLVNALILGGVMVSLFGLYQYVFTNDVITAEGVRRMRALYGSPNNLSLMLGRVIPLTGCLALWSVDRKRYWGALLAMVPALVLTFSLGGWLAVAASGLVVAALNGWRALLGATASAGAVLVASLPVLRVERIVSHLNLSEGTTALRLDIWRAAVAMIADHPAFGVGLDQFVVHYPRYMLPSAWREPNLSHPHNLLLDVWLRMGAVGVAVVMWLLASFFALAYRLYRQEGRPWQRALAVGLLASMVDFIVHGMIDNSYFVVDLAVVFWFSMAAVKILGKERGLA